MKIDYTGVHIMKIKHKDNNIHKWRRTKHHRGTNVLVSYRVDFKWLRKKLRE